MDNKPRTVLYNTGYYTPGIIITYWTDEHVIKQDMVSFDGKDWKVEEIGVYDPRILEN